MSCEIKQSVQQTYVETQSNGGVTQPVNGSWIQAYCQFLGITQPVNASWLQALCLHFGITQPLYASWTIALANYYDITTPINGSWWSALACHEGGPVVSPFIWDEDTNTYDNESRVWNTGEESVVESEFTSNENSVEEGESVTYQDQSTGQPDTWAWSFPGGSPSTSSVQNPTIQYNTVGQYDVTLTASDANSSSTITKQDWIDIVPIPQIVADFEGNNLSPQIGTSVQFTDLSTENPTQWAWSFPGGTPDTSSDQNPLIQYDIAGDYGVTLTASKTGSTSTDSKVDYIAAEDIPFIPQVIDTWLNGTGNQYFNISSGVTAANLTAKVPNTPYTKSLKTF
jgi:PKD repeat protein